jgi:murein DD-endopeptidase MepM/ murein hydrolase activator NlpD
MSCSVAVARSRRPWPLLAAVSLLALGAAGCSSDTARFDSNPFARNSGPSGDVTGSVQAQRPATVASAPISRVESRPLAQPMSSPLPPPSNRPYVSSTAPASTGVTGGNRGLASYQPPASGSDITGSVNTPPSAPTRAAPQAANRSSNWDWDGGTAVTVGPGETVAVIAHRYGVPASALMQANGITDPNQVQTGRRLVIPRFNSAASPAAPQALPAPPALATNTVRTAPAVAAPANSTVHVVAPGENLIRIAHRYKKPLVEVAKANNLPPHAQVKIGDRIVIPGVRAAAAPAAQPRPLAAAPAPLQVPGPQLASVPPAAPAPKIMANAMPRNGSAESPHVARVVTPNEAQPAAEPSAVKTAEPAGSTPGFRWPVRGRIIAGYGPKTTGQQNDGINLAVPEGTPIKAAEDGVVAYAGNELKGYGNLVLVRHSNGYVTAYAHASELLVKRGDPIKRGQVIMRAGQTGNVSSPQLHFEIRKGSSPVDPTQYLSGA